MNMFEKKLQALSKLGTIFVEYGKHSPIVNFFKERKISKGSSIENKV